MIIRFSLSPKGTLDSIYSWLKSELDRLCNVISDAINSNSCTTIDNALSPFISIPNTKEYNLVIKDAQTDSSGTVACDKITNSTLFKVYYVGTLTLTINGTAFPLSSGVRAVASFLILKTTNGYSVEQL